MRKILGWTVALAVFLGVSYVAWLYYLQQERKQEAAEIQEPLPVAPATAPPKAEAPVVNHPIVAEEAPIVAATTVDDSDKLFADFVRALFKSPTLPDFVHPDRMLRRFVATVDNLPRKEMAARLRPVKSVGGMFLTEKVGDKLIISPENSARYGRYINILESINVAMAVKFYATHYALFQKAYRDLGYPDKSFNNRLIEAIDDMLATPNVSQPIELIQPKVVYRYADPTLEASSAGQKIMLRMGPENAARVKKVLAQIRSELLRYGKQQ